MLGMNDVKISANDNVTAYGITAATSEPASILGQTNFNADVFKNDQSYIILKDGKLTVFDKGIILTN